VAWKRHTGSAPRPAGRDTSVCCLASLHRLLAWPRASWPTGTPRFRLWVGIGEGGHAEAKSMLRRHSSLGGSAGNICPPALAGAAGSVYALPRTLMRGPRAPRLRNHRQGVKPGRLDRHANCRRLCPLRHVSEFTYGRAPNGTRGAVAAARPSPTARSVEPRARPLRKAAPTAAGPGPGKLAARAA
jgi:hypothetical protein